MKKIAFAVATAGLMSLAACNQSEKAEAVEDNAANVAAGYENSAENISDVADNATNAQVASTLENSAEKLEAKADNVVEAADEKADAIERNSN